MKEMKLRRGGTCLLDDADFDKFSKYCWSEYYTNGKKYVARKTSGAKGKKSKVIFLHRAILKAPKGKVVDHTDNDGFNNQRSNIRLATQRQNSWNAVIPKSNTTGYKGVTFKKSSRKFQAEISLNKKHYFLGSFDTAEEAFRKYCEAAMAGHGEFMNKGVLAVLERLNTIQLDTNETNKNL